MKCCLCCQGVSSGVCLTLSLWSVAVVTSSLERHLFELFFMSAAQQVSKERGGGEKNQNTKVRKEGE